MVTKQMRFSDLNGPFDQGRFFGQYRFFGPIQLVFPEYGCCRKTAYDRLPSAVLRYLEVSIPCFYIPSKFYLSESSWPLLYSLWQATISLLLPIVFDGHPNTSCCPRVLVAGAASRV